MKNIGEYGFGRDWLALLAGLAASPRDLASRGILLALLAGLAASPRDLGLRPGIVLFSEFLEDGFHGFFAFG